MRHSSLVLLAFSAIFNGKSSCFPISCCADFILPRKAICPTPSYVDSSIVQSLIDTLQLFIVGDVVGDTLQNPLRVIEKPIGCFNGVCNPCNVGLLPKRPICCNERITLPRAGLGLCCNEELILPPENVELPCGLGFLPSAAPYIASIYQEPFELCTDCCRVPVASPLGCATLATPIDPDLEYCVRPVLL